MTTVMPKQLFVRSEEIKMLEGLYEMEECGQGFREMNGYPVWVQEGGDFMIHSSKHGCWRIGSTLPDDEDESDVDIEYESSEHLGQPPCSLQHLTWGDGSALIDSAVFHDPSGFIVSREPNPNLPAWATSLWESKNHPRRSGTKAERLRAERELDAVECGVVREMQRKNSEIASCGAGLVAAFFQDVWIHVAGQCIGANSEILIKASPFFAAMLKTDGNMQEATTREIRFPTADASVVRSLLAMLYSGGVALNHLKLGLPDIIELIAQAAEWQCEAVTNMLLDFISPQLSSAEASVALDFVKLATLHDDDSSDRCCKSNRWKAPLDKGIDRLAGTFDENIKILYDLPFPALKKMLQRNCLATGDNEGRVLVFAVEWLQKEESRLPLLIELLSIMRFELLNLKALPEKEKTAMRFLLRHDEGKFEEVLRTAVEQQLSLKRPRDEVGDIVADDPTGEGEDGASKIRKRLCTRSVPRLDAAQVVQLLCESWVIEDGVRRL